MIKSSLQILGILTVTVWLGTTALAQTPSLVTVAPQAAATPALNFTIVSQAKVVSSNRSTTFNLVKPPVFPSPTPSPTPPPLTAAEIAKEPKAVKFLSISATVYDHRITDLRCQLLNMDGSRVSCRVFSDINFSYFTSVAEFETADTVYDLYMSAGDASSKSLVQNDSASPEANQANQETLNWLTQAQQQLPDLSTSPTSASNYLVVESATTDDINGLIQALKDMDAYYDANHTQMIAAFQQQTAAAKVAAEATAYAQAHPTPPPPVTINLWPIKNSHYLQITGTGANQK